MPDDIRIERAVAGVVSTDHDCGDFFPRFGFETITRDEVPASGQDSVQFRGACPASAVVMLKRLPTSR